jgi:enoyl-CoA hydratase/carnithine racemase
MIVSSEPISAAEALKSGLIDEITGGLSITAG